MVKVEFHVPLEKVGYKKRDIQFGLRKKTSVRDFLNLVGEEYPLFRENFLIFSSRQKMEFLPLLIIVNEEFAYLDSMIEEGDCIKIFPIVGGG